MNVHIHTETQRHTHHMHIHIDTESHTHTHTLNIKHYTDKQNPCIKTYTNIPHYKYKNMQKLMYTK